jgi:hypothetical protein
MENTTQIIDSDTQEILETLNSPQKFRYNNFGDFKLTIIYSSDETENSYDSSPYPYRSIIENRIREALGAAVTYNYDVKMKLEHGDKIEMFVFQTWTV